MLLLFHLFALALAVLSNNPSSRLLIALRQTPFVVPYLQLLHQDYHYRIDLTNGGRLDVDYRLEADLKLEDGSQQQIVLPAPGMRGTRFQRYERLAWIVASKAVYAEETGNDELEGIIPAAICSALLKQHQATEVKFRCRGHVLQTMEAVASADPKVRDPMSENYFNQIYEAAAKLTRGQMLFTKISAKRESAPAAQ